MIIEAIQSVNEFLLSVSNEQWKTVLSYYVDFAAITGIASGFYGYYYSSKSDRLPDAILGVIIGIITAPIAAPMILLELKPVVMEKLFGVKNE